MQYNYNTPVHGAVQLQYNLPVVQYDSNTTCPWCSTITIQPVHNVVQLQYNLFMVQYDFNTTCPWCSTIPIQPVHGVVSKHFCIQVYLIAGLDIACLLNLIFVMKIPNFVPD